MPFLGDNQWMSGADKIWVWLVLTIPTTMLCFWVYLAWSRRESGRKARTTRGDLEMQSGAGLGS